MTFGGGVGCLGFWVWPCGGGGFMFRSGKVGEGFDNLVLTK